MSLSSLRLRDLRIGVRLAAAFALSGLFVVSGAYLGLSAQAAGADKQAEIDRVVTASQISDDLLININDVTGWQGLYIADVPAFGLDAALDEESYNRGGYLRSKDTIEELFATYDRGQLTAGERRILARTEADFEQLFTEDDKIVALLRRQGLEAFPQIMTSLNGGPAGEAWNKTYEEMTRLDASFDKRIAALRAERREMAAAGYTRVIASLGLAVLAAVAVVVAVTRSIVRPLRRTVEALETAADGRLDERLGDEARDEIGQLARALDRTVGSIGTTLGDLDRTALALADGSDRLSSVSSHMSTSAAESSSQADLVSGGAVLVSDNVQTVAAGTEQMSASIREIAQQATHAAGVATQAVQVAESTTRTVARLGESSQEVGNVVKVINSITEQTNLLALNATIEAARAGDAGKGFSVVADEVKQLSRETAKATDDIARRIEAIQQDTRAAVDAIADITRIIDQINDSQLTIAAAVEEQTATTDEMSRSVSDAAAGTTDIALNIGGLARTASDTQAAADTTQDAAHEFADLAQQVRGLVGQFRY